MLSYKTIIAIQLLQAILDAGEKGLTVTELKDSMRLQDMAVSQTAFMLRKNEWVGLKNKNRHVVITSLENKSLYDLVMLTDKRIQLSTHIILKHWANGSHKTMQKPMKINQCLHDTVKKRLQKVRMTDLVRVGEGKNKMAMAQEK